MSTVFRDALLMASLTGCGLLAWLLFGLSRAPTAINRLIEPTPPSTFQPIEPDEVCAAADATPAAHELYDFRPGVVHVAAVLHGYDGNYMLAFDPCDGRARFTEKLTPAATLKIGERHGRSLLTACGERLGAWVELPRW